MPKPQSAATDSMTIGEVAQNCWCQNISHSALGTRGVNPIEEKQREWVQSVYSYRIKIMKQLLNDLETQHYKQVERSFQLALQKFNCQLRNLFLGIAELMKYVGFYKVDTE